MPVEVVNDKGARRRLRFVRNTSYNGTDYGPDYETDVAEVDSHWSAVFLGNGRAVEISGEVEIKAVKTGQVQTRDPEPQHRDPELPLSGEKKK